MEHVSQTRDERSVLRWGGLAGVLSAFLLLIVFGIVGAFVGTDYLSAAPEGLVAGFADIRGVRIIENGLYLAVLALWLTHVAALYHYLRGPRPAAALFGGVFAALGISALVAGALPHIATTPISDLYHAPGTSPEQQAALVMLWQATQGIFDALLVTGLFVLPLGLIAFGLAMRATPAFGTWIGGLAVGLGAIAFASGVVNLVEVSGIAAIGFFALIAFHLVVGWKTYRLSREPGSAAEAATHAELPPRGRPSRQATGVFTR